MAYTTIKKPSDYFNTNLYTGNNTETSHTGIGFQPDLTWLKVRNASGSHYWFDTIRGATNYIRSDNTAAEVTSAETLKSFDSDGYTVGTSNAVNTNTETMVGWNWLADNTSGSSNTDGSITSTVSANTTSGFSIVSYTGTGANATVGHGLGVVPKMLIIKNRDDGTGHWRVYHASVGATKFGNFDGTDSFATASTPYNNTDPTSSFFSIGTDTRTNASGQNMIAYCFAEVKGFSKFGSYVGNGSTDGTFVYTGFKPAWVMTKRYNTTENWYIKDIKRSVFNPVDEALYANSSVVELSNWSGATTDYLSNGFKIRTVDTAHNGSGDTYIYMAFAEEPLVGDNPATAR